MIRRPLSILVLVSATLFATYHVAAPRFDNTIALTGEDVDGILRFTEDLRGQLLTESARDTVVQAFVEDEMLIREAYRSGIDRGDPRVRGFLVEVARNALQPDAPDVTPPTDSQLVAYFDEHGDRYTILETLTFDQVFFPFGILDPEVETSVRDSLRRGVDPAMLVAGIDFANTTTVRGASRTSVSRSFGRQFANQLFDLTHGEWHGPLRSGQGAHYVRIIDRQSARERAYEEVRNYVEQDWYVSRDIASTHEVMQQVRRRYDVRIGGR